MIEGFLGAAVAGFGAILSTVAMLAWRRARETKMAVLALAFAAAAAGGLLLALGQVLGGAVAEATGVAFPSAVLACLVLLYVALFARNR